MLQHFQALPAEVSARAAGGPAREVLKRHARSFWLAARFLPEAQMHALARLYAFCRHADDLADAEPAGVNAAALHALRDALEKDLPFDEISADILALQREHDLPRSVLLDFMDALIADQYERRLATLNDLVRFGYGVASTVGLLICRIVGVRESVALPFAVDLGIAMQITNVCRDVLEDAGRGRVYVPADLARQNLAADALLTGDSGQRNAAFATVRELLQVADTYYASAERGMRYLPRNVRPGILVAARVYREIGTEILRQPDRYWERRAVVPRARKLLLVSKALYDSVISPVITGRTHPHAHDASLHVALRKPATQGS